MIIDRIVEAAKQVLPARRPIEHHEPWIEAFEGYAVNGCLTKNIVGHYYVDKFEEKLRQITGAENVVAMSSGTAALHIALLVTGVLPGEEVIVPASTFVGTANAVCCAGAIPHFIDCGLAINPYKLRQYLAKQTTPAIDKRGRINKETGRLIKAIIVVHLFGFPSPIQELMEIANNFGLEVIEDAAEALGSTILNRQCGTFCTGILSFNNNKIVTTNGGGALLTNDPWIAAKARQLSTTARVDHPWEVIHDAIAFNYRLPNLNAALGVGQLTRFERILAAKRELARSYSDNFAGVGGSHLVRGLHPCPGRPNYWLNVLILDVGNQAFKDKILKALHDEGIKARASFIPLHKLPMFKNNPRSDNVMHMAEDLYRSAICLPSGPGLVNERSGHIDEQSGRRRPDASSSRDFIEEEDVLQEVAP